MRIILFSGKGGVGKTTLAAATAVRAATLGHRVLVLSTDAAHSLGDSLALTIGAEPVQVAENLDAMEVDVHHELERGFGPIRNFLTRFFKGQGLAKIELGVASKLISEFYMTGISKDAGHVAG